MVDQELPASHATAGPGNRVLHATTASLSDTDTHDTGFSNVVAASLTPTTDGAAATVNSTSNGVITVGLTDDAGAAITTDETIHIVAVCER